MNDQQLVLRKRQAATNWQTALVPRKPTGTSRRFNRRGGFTVLELIVSAVLLIGLISLVAPLTVRAGRLWQEARSYRLAVNELTNEIDRLTLIDDQSRSEALSAWKPSPQLQRVLPQAKLTGQVLEDGDGKRLKLSLDWKRPGNPQPVTLVAWIPSTPIKP